MLSVCTECCHAPASCKYCSVRGFFRQWLVCPGPEWWPPPTQPQVPLCRCLRCQTTGNTSQFSSPLSPFIVSMSQTTSAFGVRSLHRVVTIRVSLLFFSFLFLLSAHQALRLWYLQVFAWERLHQLTDFLMLSLVQMRADTFLSGKHKCDDKKSNLKIKTAEFCFGFLFGSSFVSDVVRISYSNRANDISRLVLHRDHLTSQCVNWQQMGQEEV